MEMAFNLLLMGKSVFLCVLPIMGRLEWSTTSKCGLISEKIDNSSNLLSYECATPNDVAQGGFSLFDSDFPLLVCVDITVDSNSEISLVSLSWVWTEVPDEHIDPQVPLSISPLSHLSLESGFT